MKFAALTLVAALVATFATATFAADKKSKLKVKPYPMDTCVVSGEKLGSMGDAFVLVEGDQEVQLCCKSCQKDFNKDKKASLAKINDAWKKVKPYTATTCIVSGDALESGKAVGVVHDGAEYQFCCKDCVKEFKKDTAKFAKKLAETSAK